MDVDIGAIVKQIKIPNADSHKGQNGRLLLIGGSQLFHAASLWSLTVASRIVDLVHYASVKENAAIVHELKKEFRNGIVVPRIEIEEYIKEDDCVLIGPGMVRTEKVVSHEAQGTNIKDIEDIQDEGIQTWALTNYLLKKYTEKQWVIDAGAIQMIEVENIPHHAILTPHHQEFELLCKKEHVPDKKSLDENVKQFAQNHQCIVLVKGHTDIVSDGNDIYIIEGGNAGMTKGGTGDVLAGLIASLACKNDPLTATIAGSFINKKAGDDLFASMGPFFNATDLANQIPKTMAKFFSATK